MRYNFNNRMRWYFEESPSNWRETWWRGARRGARVGGALGALHGVYRDAGPASMRTAIRLKRAVRDYSFDLNDPIDRRFIQNRYNKMTGERAAMAGLMGHGAGRIVGGVLGGGAAVAGEGIARGARAIRAKIAAARAARAARAAEGL